MTLLEIGDKNVCISWINPSNSGTPAFEQFQIEVISIVSFLKVTIDSTKSIYCVEGLKPNTEYNLTIRALSVVEQLGVLASDPIAVQFNTTFEGENVCSFIACKLHACKKFSFVIHITSVFLNLSNSNLSV